MAKKKPNVSGIRDANKPKGHAVKGQVRHHATPYRYPPRVTPHQRDQLKPVKRLESESIMLSIYNRDRPLESEDKLVVLQPSSLVVHDTPELAPVGVPKRYMTICSETLLGHLERSRSNI